MADSLIQLVKDGFGSALLTHLDCSLGFSLISGLKLKHWKLISTIFTQFRPSALQLSKNIMVTDQICSSAYVCVCNPVADVVPIWTIYTCTHTYVKNTKEYFKLCFRELVILASVQISYPLCFSAHLIRELKPGATSYADFESQRGSALRFTQIATFNVALSLCFSFFFCCAPSSVLLCNSEVTSGQRKIV